MSSLDPQEKAALRAKEGLRAGTWSFSFGGERNAKSNVVAIAVVVGIVVGLIAVIAAVLLGGTQ